MVPHALTVRFPGPAEYRRPVEVEEIIRAMQLEVDSGNLPDVTDEILVREWLLPGLYARECTLAAGTLAAGKVHRFGHLVTLSAGRVRALFEDGSVETVEAPHTWECRAGAQRAVYAEEDAVWTTYDAIPRHVRTVEEAFAYVTCDNFDSFIAAQPKRVSLCQA